jgi:formylglycine-generating enzyme required for sulfatase activity
MKNMIAIILVFTFASCVRAAELSKEMIKVEGGDFIMGNAEFDDRNPAHKVTLNDFYMAKYLVTVGEWKEFLAEMGYSYNWDWQDQGLLPFREIVPTDDCPAQGLNWYYAAEYCNWLSRRDGLKPCYTVRGGEEFFHGDFHAQYFELKEEELPVVTWNKKANGYRLPTEAEWEYAARGGQLSKGYLYAGSDDPDEVGRYGQERSYPVGQMKPNELGLYDMTGNAEAWCWDWYDKDLSWLPERNPSVDNRTDIKKPSRLSEGYGYGYKVWCGVSWEWGVARNVYMHGGYPARHLGFKGIRLVRNG